MAFGTHKSSSEAHNAKYSKLLGQIVLQSPAVDAILKSISDDVKRSGYVDKSARELRKQVQEVGGLFDSALEGKLNFFAVQEGEDGKGIKREYVKVGVATEVPNDKGELKPSTVFLSVPLKSKEGLALVHKLVNAEFGEPVKLSMFAQMGEPKEDGKQYANHTVGMSKNGVKVESVFPMTLDEINSMRKQLKAEGEDNEDIAKALIKEEYKRTLPQIEIVQQKADNYREARHAAGDDHEHGEAAGASATNGEPVMPNEAESQARRQQAVGDDMSFDDDMI